jgi:hypothetical protein
MQNSLFAATIIFSVTVTVVGCKKPVEQCAPGDSPGVCQQVQKCFQSDTSVEVCREGEKDANAVESNKRKP